MQNLTRRFNIVMWLYSIVKSWKLHLHFWGQKKNYNLFLFLGLSVYEAVLPLCDISVCFYLTGSVDSTALPSHFVGLFWNPTLASGVTFQAWLECPPSSPCLAVTRPRLPPGSRSRLALLAETCDGPYITQHFIAGHPVAGEGVEGTPQGAPSKRTIICLTTVVFALPGELWRSPSPRAFSLVAFWGFSFKLVKQWIPAIMLGHTGEAVSARSDLRWGI